MVQPVARRTRAIVVSDTDQMSDGELLPSGLRRQASATTGMMTRRFPLPNT